VSVDNIDENVFLHVQHVIRIDVSKKVALAIRFRQNVHLNKVRHEFYIQITGNAFGEIPGFCGQNNMRVSI
jgi:hypothetical protein